MFPELVYAIDNTLKQIESDTKELAVLKGFRICANCGAEQDRTFVTCTQCGMNLDEAERIVNAQEAVKFCGGCGKPLTSGSKFCMNCGTKIE